MLPEVDAKELFANHFSVDAHRHVFVAMMYLYSKNAKISALSIQEVLVGEKSKKAIEEIGGLDYLLAMETSNVPQENLHLFIDKVKQSYVRKSLIEYAEEIRAFALSEESEKLNQSELLGKAEKILSDMSAESASYAGVYKMGTDTDSVLEERAKNPSKIAGLSVGMPSVDDYTGGGQPGDLIVVCAESKTGKSVLLQNWETKLSVIDKLPTLYVDSEMYSRQQEDRKLAMLSGVPEKEIINGMYVLDTENGRAEDKINRIKKAKEMLKEGNSYHIYMPHFNLEKVSAIARQFQLKIGIVALFFDYIKIPSSEGSRKTQEYQELGYFTSGLKDLAGILNIPIYSACQATREELGNTDKDAKSIGGSYRILQLASKLLFLTNKTTEQIAKDGIQNGNQVLSIKYQRNGESDCPPINIYFDKPILLMTET